jgi:hypothetical protein
VFFTFVKVNSNPEASRSLFFFHFANRSVFFAQTARLDENVWIGNNLIVDPKWNINHLTLFITNFSIPMQVAIHLIQILFINLWHEADVDQNGPINLFGTLPILLHFLTAPSSLPQTQTFRYIVMYSWKQQLSKSVSICKSLTYSLVSMLLSSGYKSLNSFSFNSSNRFIRMIFFDRYQSRFRW